MAAPDPVLDISARYEIHEKLGEGGVGLVYKARDTVLDQWVAIKVMLFETDEGVVRFQQEARAIARLNHENIVRVFDFGQTADGKLYMVSEFLGGSSLKDLIRRRGSLSEAEAIPVFEQIARGLSYAHKNRAIHRDLKPANVMLIDDEGAYRVKLIDFGLVKLAGENQDRDQNQGLTSTGVGIGSPPYMSPEQAQGMPVDEGTDIYAMGCLIFETLSGRPPFQGETAIETIRMHLSQEPPCLSDVAGDAVSDSLASLVADCLAKDRSSRPASLEEVLSRLAGAETEPVLEHVPASPAKKAGSPVRIAILALLVAGLSAAFFFFRSQDPSPELETAAERNYDMFDRVPASEGPQFSDLGNEKYGLIDCRDEDLERFASEHPRAREVELELSALKGYGLKYLKGLPVRYINLDRVQIRDRDFEYLADLPLLQTIHMQNNFSMKGPGFKALARLPKLGELKLTNSHLTESAMMAIAEIKRPMRIDMTGCFFPSGSLRHLRPLELDRLHLCQTEINSLDGLRGAYCRELHLENTPGIADADFSCLAEVRGLEALNIDNCNVKSGGIGAIARLERLNWLSMIGCQAGPVELAQLARFSRVADLGLTVCGRPDEFYKALCGLRELRSLTVAGARLADIAPLSGARVSRLELRNSDACGSDVLALDRVPGIKRLVLTGCKIDQDFFEQLGEHGDIRDLTLAECRLTGRQIAQIESLKRLELLTIRDVPLKDDARQRIRGALSSTRVQID
ncbi:MAG: protein kinase [Candidatus Melainabacteria bacterium]|nr:protein kinase [Candidatus Melainabacteria bacterium]